MALKDSWIDRIDGVDIASAKDINDVANAVIELEKNGIITVDQYYSPESENAQSGIAVGEAFGQAVTQATLNAQGYTNQEVEKLLEYYPPEDGEDGFSPIISTYPIPNGTQIVILDKQGEKDFNVYNGEQGEDGISPLVSVEKIESGHNVTITDAEGTQSFEVKNGENYILTPADKQEIINEVLLEIPSGGITEEDVQEIIAQIPDEVSVTDNEDEPFPEGADIQIMLGDKETPPVNADFASMVKASLNKETWTFTLEDGTTVQKAVYVE